MNAYEFEIVDSKRYSELIEARPEIVEEFKTNIEFFDECDLESRNNSLLFVAFESDSKSPIGVLKYVCDPLGYCVDPENAEKIPKGEVLTKSSKNLLSYVCVSPEHQNRKVATILIERFFQHLKESRENDVVITEYLPDGLACCKHVIERISKKYSIVAFDTY